MRLLLVIYLPLLLLFTLVVQSVVSIQGEAQSARLQMHDAARVRLAAELLEHQLEMAFSDLLVLEQTPEVRRYLDTASAAALQNLTDLFVAIVSRKQVYDQIRYLDEQGQERVRVDYRGGQSLVVPAELLQNKRDRYYFSELMQHPPGRIYVSPLDLNIERGQIERPHQPMIRIGIRLQDADHNTSGILMLNLKGGRLLQQFRHVMSGDSAAVLLNADGDWLVAPEPKLEWNFMLGGGHSFAQLYVSVWQTLQAQEQGNLLTADGLFTFDRARPLQGYAESVAGFMPGRAAEYVWRVVAWRPLTALPAASILADRASTWIYFSGLLLFLALSLYLAIEITRRQQQQRAIRQLAYFDPLTQLPNRRLLFERLEPAIAQSLRQQRSLALMFVDLDHFKDINDRYGHQGGDELLQAVAGRLREAVRDTDTVFRQGGDEFVILLPDAGGPQGAAQLAQRLLDCVRSPVFIRQQAVNAGISIGVACCPEHGSGVDELIQQADDAMYVAKAHGRNHYVLAGQTPSARFSSDQTGTVPEES